MVQFPTGPQLEPIHTLRYRWVPLYSNMLNWKLSCLSKSHSHLSLSNCTLFLNSLISKDFTWFSFFELSGRHLYWLLWTQHQLGRHGKMLSRPSLSVVVCSRNCKTRTELMKKCSFCFHPPLPLFRYKILLFFIQEGELYKQRKDGRCFFKWRYGVLSLVLIKGPHPATIPLNSSMVFLIHRRLSRFAALHKFLLCAFYYRLPSQRPTSMLLREVFFALLEPVSYLVPRQGRHLYTQTLTAQLWFRSGSM